MTLYKTVTIIFLFVIFSGFTGCRKSITNNDYLVSFNDTINEGYGYKNRNGDIVIAAGKYAMCITDTFRTYAIVAKPQSGFVAIDRGENILYEVFPYDNGPDNVSEGLFRIKDHDKIGFADAKTGKVIIRPQFDCAWPFEHGVAKVSNNCKTEVEGEHINWVSDSWFNIDKTGKKVEQPK